MYEEKSPCYVEESYVYSGSFCIGQLIDTGVSYRNQVNRGGQERSCCQEYASKCRENGSSPSRVFSFSCRALHHYDYSCNCKKLKIKKKKVQERVGWGEEMHTHTKAIRSAFQCHPMSGTSAVTLHTYRSVTSAMAMMQFHTLATRALPCTKQGMAATCIIESQVRVQSRARSTTNPTMSLTR